MGRSFLESVCTLLLGSMCVFVLCSGEVGSVRVDVFASLEMMVIVEGFRVVILISFGAEIRSLSSDIVISW